MDLIFNNGSELYKKHQNLDGRLDLFFQSVGINMCHYQQKMIEKIIEQNKKDFNIYGDDFKIEIVPKNIEGNCTLVIKDYDENQKLECSINIGFNKDELNQFINLLQIIKDKM